MSDENEALLLTGQVVMLLNRFFETDMTKEELREEIHRITMIEERRIDIMAIYSGKQSMLDASLGEYAGYGFRLVEPDDHITELYFKDKCIARYNQDKLTIPELHKGCKNYLESIARWQND